MQNLTPNSDIAGNSGRPVILTDGSRHAGETRAVSFEVLALDGSLLVAIAATFYFPLSL